VAESVECAACGGRDVYVVEQWPVRKGARGFACRTCGALFVQPFPLQAPSAPKVTAAGSSAPSVPAKKGAAGALIASLDRFFAASQPRSGARVLDLACGSGGWLNAFQDHGWDTAGIDTSADTAFARHTRLDALPQDPQFDLVIVHHALERRPRSLDTLLAVSRSLRPEGYCLVNVPRLETLAEHRDVAFCFGHRKSAVAFTEPCLRGLLARAGLEVVAALHDLDEEWSNGEPRALRLLARKAASVTPEPDPAAALAPVFQALAVVAEGPAPTAPLECPACSGRNVQRWEQWRLSKKRDRAAACMDCGLLFVHPQPSMQTLAELYTPEGYAAWKTSNQTDKAWANLDAPKVETERRPTPALFELLDDFFPASAAAGASVLDFGCGPGTWLDRFQEHGWDTYGLEPCTNAAFSRHKQLRNVPSAPRFDLVFLYHVLEHLPRPLDTLRELAEAIVPGGYLLVSVPRLDRLSVHGQAEYCLHPRHHIVAFTEPCLRGLLARAGLTCVASLSDSKSAIKRGMPTKLQLLARRTTTPPPLEPNPGAALKPVLEAFIALQPVRG